MKEEGVYHAHLKARAGANLDKPPISGWQFHIFETDNFVDDEALTCSVASTSPGFCLTVSLNGLAKEIRGKCEGEYKSTGLTSMGRQVDDHFIIVYLPFCQVFKLEGSDDCYLFVRDQWTSWSIWSSLSGEQVYIDSGSAGQACPAHPRNASNLRFGENDWKINKADGNYPDIMMPGHDDWEEGGVVFRCSLHTN